MEEGDRLVFDVKSGSGFDEELGELEITRREDGGALNGVMRTWSASWRSLPATLGAGVYLQMPVDSSRRRRDR